MQCSLLSPLPTYAVEYVPAPHACATVNGEVQKDPAGHSVHVMAFPVL